MCIALITNPKTGLVRTLYINNSDDQKGSNCQQNISKSNSVIHLENDKTNSEGLNPSYADYICKIKGEKIISEKREVIQRMHQLFKTENLTKLEMEGNSLKFLIFTKTPLLTSYTMTKATAALPLRFGGQRCSLCSVLFDTLF